jgi:hypothetical protein
MSQADTATVEVLPEPEEHRVARTGAVSSVQEAEVSIPPRALQRLWRAETLEWLAQGYWLYLRRVSLGLIRVRYGARDRTVILAVPWLPLLRFRAPEYQVSSASGSVAWRIERGLLVAGEGRDRGWLRIEVSRSNARNGEAVHIRVEVRNFYPWLRGSGRFARVGAWLYSRTQLRIHRRVTVGFLRSLSNVELE